MNYLILLTTKDKTTDPATSSVIRDESEQSAQTTQVAQCDKSKKTSEIQKYTAQPI